MTFLVAIIILSATLIGAICGLGGGVIIKPLLDSVSNYSTFQISVISGACVLAMSTTSLTRHLMLKTKIDVKKAIFLAIGSTFGGIIGSSLFNLIENFAISIFDDKAQMMVKIFQNSFLFILISLILCYMIFLKKKNICANVTNPILTIIIGCILGIISVALDIGGGPINVCVFALLFGMDVKASSVCSILTIFVAQVTKFIKWGLTGAFVKNTVFNEVLPVYMLLILIFVAVCGGLIGTKINKKVSKSAVNTVYCCALVFVICLSFYNIILNTILLLK